MTPRSEPENGAAARRSPTDGPPAALCVVVPAYNEARRLGRTLARIRDYMAAGGVPCEVIVADDGSRDGTPEVVTGFDAAPLCVRLIQNPRNRGKGYAVRQGVLVSTGALVLMSDADLSAPIEEVEKLRPWLERGYDIVIGSRDLPESVLDPPQPRLRRWMAWTFRGLRRRLLLPELRDTQCGFKLFRGDVARRAFALCSADGWLFDCEVLAIAQRLGYRVKEVGVVWRNDPDSRVRPLREALRAVPTLWRIRRRVARL